MSVDLTKGFFGHFNLVLFMQSKFQERLKLQYMYFAGSYNGVKLLLSCNTIKMQVFLIKLSDRYQVCCHGNSFAHGLPSSFEPAFEVGYVISYAYVNSVCVDLFYLYSLCSCIPFKLTKI